MKDTSIEKLSEVYNALNNTENQHLAKLIQDVIRAEATAKVKGSKFDIFKYCANDKIRPVLATVFHDQGFRVASDAKILVAIKGDYPEEYEHKMLHADGSFEEYGTYPKWRSVIPKPDGYEPYKVDPAKFYEWIEGRRAAYKTENGKGTKWSYDWQVKVGAASLKAELFDKMLTAMKEIGADEVMVKDEWHSTYAYAGESVVLLIPSHVVGSEPENLLILA